MPTKIVKKIDQYILEEITTTLLGATSFIIFVLLMFQILRIADYLIVHRASLSLIAQMTFYLCISFLSTALPLGFLIAISVGFARLSSDSELIAMKAHGYSLLRLALPVCVLASAVSIFSAHMSRKWVPQSMWATKEIQIKIANSKVVTAMREGTFNTGFFDLLLFADEIDSKTNRLHHIFIYDEREPKNPLTYVAQEAEIISLKSNSELGAAVLLRLYQGSVHHNHLDTSVYEKLDFAAYNLHLNVNENQYIAVPKPQMIAQSHLLQKIQKTTPMTQEGRQLRAEYWRRIATTLSPFVFVFLGIGLGSFRQRTVKSGPLLTSFLVFFFYWILQILGTEAVTREILPPWIAMQIPNALGCVVGWISFKLCG